MKFADFLEIIKLNNSEKLRDSVRKTKLVKFPDFYT
jgi:hypothetical protein